LTSPTVSGRFRKLTLISAPAGYGKSILASIWQSSCGCPAAWVSLDENDDDLMIFLSYFVAAVQTIFPAALTKMEALLTGQMEP
jgi:LuxR family maltose regulon positive regulatory protein